MIDPITEALEERNAQASLRESLEVQDLKRVMSNKAGRRFVYRQLEIAGVWRGSFNTNALSMAFNEGARNQGLRLLAEITEHCFDRYTEMMQESKA